MMLPETRNKSCWRNYLLVSLLIDIRVFVLFCFTVTRYPFMTNMINLIFVSTCQEDKLVVERESRAYPEPT